MLINLLPHRDWALARQRQRFARSLAVAALLALAFAAALHALLEPQHQAQAEVNRLLKKEIAALDAELKSLAKTESELGQLTAREAALRALSFERHLPRLLLQEVALLMPEGLYLTQLKQEGPVLQIHGLARSGNEVFDFLRRLAARGRGISRPALMEMTSATTLVPPAEPGAVAFVLHAELQWPGEPADASATAGQGHAASGGKP
jgi:type IV pilus assembly protein PilN